MIVKPGKYALDAKTQGWNFCHCAGHNWEWVPSESPVQEHMFGFWICSRCNFFIIRQMLMPWERG